MLPLSEPRKLAGALICLGALQFIICMTTAEALYPGYDISKNAISDLGVGRTALLFNASVILLGLSVLFGTYLIYGVLGSRIFPFFLALAGIGAVGVGVFPETAGWLHVAATLLVFLFGGLSALFASSRQKPPFSYFSLSLGAITLIALALLVSDNFMGLGAGGMERMVAYPVLLWGVAFGAKLMAGGEASARVEK